MTDSARVLWLTPDKPDNISVGRSRLAMHLREDGYAVTVRGTTPKTVARSLRERGAYDVVIGTTRAGAMAGMVVSAVHGIPLVVDHIDPISQFYETHPTWLARLVEPVETFAFRRSAETLFVYEAERERVAQAAPRTTKTALGVDFDRFATPGEAVLSAGRELLPAGLEHPIAVYVGGLEPIYNIEAMLEAGTRLKTGSLVIAGAGSLADSVREAAASSGSVVFLGSISHDTVPGLLAACDVGVSLVDDPHTLKVLEYGAAGLPVVQLDGRARDRFGDRLTYTEADPEAISSAIETAATEGDGAALRSYVEQFDWQAIAEQYAEAVDRVI